MKNILKGAKDIQESLMKSSEMVQEISKRGKELKDKILLPKKQDNSLPEDEIIYLTGMSINKKTFHAVYDLMSQDQDFVSAKQTLYDDIEKISLWFSSYKRDKKPNQVREIFNNVAETNLNAIMEPILSNVFTYVSFAGICLQVIKIIADEDVKKLDQGIYGEELIKEIYNNKDSILQELKEMRWSNFFSVFQSNQSDSRGVTAIASGKANAFALNYGYSDKPFYENVFINSLTISLNNNLKELIDEKKFQSIYQSVYQAHIIDIIGARVLRDSIFKAAENTYLKDNEDNEDNEKNIRELYSEEAENTVKQSLQNRNLFGIDLLSRFLLELVTEIKKEQSEKNLPFTTLKVYTIKRKNEIQLFTQELFEYGSCPVSFEFTNDKKVADLIIDCQYLNNDKLEPKELILNPNQVTIPIKYFIALPIIISGKGKQVPTRDIFVPERVVHDATDNKVMNVYTVGGIEHNRPLMRLVNIHRQQSKDHRQLGFFDNHFDYYHKFKNLRKPEYNHYFLMGANQLVSGLNEFHFGREDDHTGNSISTASKLIYFNLKDGGSKFLENKEELTWHVVSIYGFSALASAYATLWTIINIKESIENPGNFITFNNDSKKYTKSLVFKSLHLKDRDALKNNMKVYTRRIKFKNTDFMEKQLKEICNGLEPFSQLRLEYLKPAKERKLIHFMKGTGDFEDDDKKAVLDIQDGRATTK